MEPYSGQISPSRSIVQFEGDSVNQDSENLAKTKKNTPKMNVYEVDPKIESYIEAIKTQEEYRDLCRSTEKFEEAEEAQKKIQILKEELLMYKQRDLEKKHREEKQRLDELQVEEMEKLVYFWDQKIEEYKRGAQGLVDNALEKYKSEHEELVEGLKTSLSTKTKINPQRLVYQKTIDTLVKRNDFAEARRLKNLCSEMEKEDLEKMKEEREGKIKIAVQQLARKQMNELNVLKARINTGLANLHRMKESECDRLKLKFQNILKEVLHSQAQEKVRLESIQKFHCGEKSKSFYKSNGFGANKSSVNLRGENLFTPGSPKKTQPNQESLTPKDRKSEKLLTSNSRKRSTTPRPVIKSERK